MSGQRVDAAGGRAVGETAAAPERTTGRPSVPDQRPPARPGGGGLRQWIETRQRYLLPLGVWLCTRLVTVAMMITSGDHAWHEVEFFYHPWGETLSTGAYPEGDVTWQYPPGAALVMLAPYLIGGVTYVQAFALLVLAFDLLITASLLLSGRSAGRSLAGAWVWVGALPLMLFVPYTRFDVLVTACVVLSLLLINRWPLLAGVLAALGASVKVWPAAVLVGARPGRQLIRSWASAAAAIVAVCAGLATVLRGAFGFLSAQGGRGLELESLGGSALLLAHGFGYPGWLEYRYGSIEVVGPYAAGLAQASIALSVAGFAALLLWRLRARTWSAATPADAALTAVLVFTTTSRVISPQYVIWLLGIAAVCLTFRETTQRPVVALLVLTTALTAVEYPLFFDYALRLEWAGIVPIVLRNVALLTATVWSGARLWRATVPSGRRR